MAINYPSYVNPAPGGGFLAGLANGQKIVGAAGDQIAAAQQEGRTNDTLSTLGNNLYAPPAAGATPTGPSGADLQKFGLPDQATLQGLLANPDTRNVGLEAISNARSAYQKANDPLTKLQLEKEQLSIAQLQHPRGPGPTEQMRNFDYAQDHPGFQDFVNQRKAGAAPAAVQEYLYYRDQAAQSGEKPMSFMDFRKSGASGGMNANQSLAAGYADRMREADGVLANPALLDAQTSPLAAAASATPFIGNFIEGSDRQVVDQAQRNFVNAILRRESGAAIASSEFDQAKKQYFPQPGDSEAVIQQKAQNRNTAIQGLARAAGPNYAATDASGAPSGAEQAPSGAAPSEAPVQISGDDEYNALPSGAQFIDPDGNTRQKP